MYVQPPTCAMGCTVPPATSGNSDNLRIVVRLSQFLHCHLHQQTTFKLRPLWSAQCTVIGLRLHCSFLPTEGASMLDSMPPREHFLGDFLRWLAENGVDHSGVEVMAVEGKGLGLRTKKDLHVRENLYC